MLGDSIAASRATRARLGIAVLVGLLGGGLGITIGNSPLFAVLGVLSAVSVVYFLRNFEQSVLLLLIARSALDSFSGRQLPAIFAIAINLLAVIYLLFQWVQRRSLKVDWFWYFLLSWGLIQTLWIVLLPLGGLGFDSAMLAPGLREWVRRFSWVTVYFLVMQLKGRVAGTKIIGFLLLSLIIPLFTALLQVFLPTSLLPGFLTFQNDVLNGRVFGTLGFPNNLAIYLSLFIGIAGWKLTTASRPLGWIALLVLITFVYINTGYLTGLVALGAIILFANLARMNVLHLVGGAIAFCIVLVIFAKTGVGQARLAELADVPFLNPDVDLSRAIVLANSGNSSSMNWRITHWHYLLQSWQDAPWLGYGISTAPYLSPLRDSGGRPYTPHNDYFRFLVEQGVVGLGLFIAFLTAQFIYLIQALRRCVSHVAQYQFVLVLLAILVSTCIAMFTNNVLDATAFFFYWWTCFAVSGWSASEFEGESCNS